MQRTARLRPARGLLLATLAVVASIGPTASAHALSPPSPAVTAGDLGYPYPNAPDCDEQTGANCIKDQWGFIQGQCHSWVAYRLNELNAAELNGTTFNDTWNLPPGDEWGNPPNWPTAAQQAGVTMDTTPALGSVAWWSENGGHVAYVEAVNSDGSIQISEMNADYHNGFDFATLTTSGRWPDKFIHIADRPPDTTPTTFSIKVNGSSTTSTVNYGQTVTLSESGIASAATGSVVFSSPGHANLCTVTLPATSCTMPSPVATGSYSPISASFHDTDGQYSSATSTNTVSLTVNKAPPAFSIGVDGGTNASVPRGSTLTFSASGLPGDAAGGVVFSTAAIPSICTVTLPATSCVGGLPVGSYLPVTATFTPSDANYASSTATNSLTVSVMPVTPSAPRSPHATVTDQAATVTWSAPSDNGGAAITDYWVTRIPGNQTVAVSGAVTHASFPNLAGGTYQFSIRAWNRAGASPVSTASNAVTVTSARTGYWMLGRGGAVYGFGNAVRFGDAAHPMVAIAARRDGLGYWTVDAYGRVQSFGRATTHGGSPALRPGESVTTIAATRSGNGYWLFTNQGRAFRYGDAQVFGDMSNVHLNGPIIASAVTASGKGYYMVGSDGGVFTFGDARFHGSTGALKLNQPVVGIAAAPNGRGYWLVASDGGVFAFDAPFRGSMGRVRLNRPVVGLVAFGNGYLMVASDGGIFDFSNKPFLGSLGGVAVPAPIVGVAAFAHG